MSALVAQKRRKPIQQYNKHLQDTMVYRYRIVLTYRGQLLSEIKDGTAKECFATHLYENRIEYGLNDHETMFAGPAVLISVD
jgi:hypothetical protein